MICLAKYYSDKNGLICNLSLLALKGFLFQRIFEISRLLLISWTTCVVGSEMSLHTKEEVNKVLKNRPDTISFYFLFKCLATGRNSFPHVRKECRNDAK